MDYLRQLLLSNTAQGRLDRAALDLAQIHFPDLDHNRYLNQINELASQLGDRLRNFNDGRDFVETAQRYLFGELGFHANQHNFYDPANSCLNYVLEHRTGIPITLSLVYMEIARRLHMPVYGISLPNRFLVQFDDGRFATFVDPYGGGEQVSLKQCFMLAGVEQLDLSLLSRATPKQILIRMLQNLQGAYVRAHDYPRAITALNLLLEGAPDQPAWLKLRGALLLDQKQYVAACADLERYLELQPASGESDAIRGQIRHIRQWIAQRN